MELEINRPNILWICTDQQRYDTIGGLNNPFISTPNLDRLCAEGVAFDRAYSQSPVCSPSRASFLTGLYPSTAHVNRNGLPGFPDQPHIQLITKRLADVGYECGLSGKLHIASGWKGVEERTEDGYHYFKYSHSPGQGIERGNEYTDWLIKEGIDLKDIFQRYDERANAYYVYRPEVDPTLHQAWWCTDRAIDFISEDREKPWMMSVNFFDPHPPFDALDSYRNRYDARALPPPLFKEQDLDVQDRLVDFFFQRQPIPPGQQQKKDKANYYADITLVDEQVGRLLNALEKTGQRESTAIIFTSDHGEMLGDHGLTLKGCRFYEGLVRVPLIFSWPGVFKHGLIANGLVELTDLAPTIAGLAGTKLTWTHGKSLLPILTGRASPDTHRDFVRCEYYDALNPYAPNHPELHTPCWATMYRDERFKLVVYHGSDYGELYDLESDPSEFQNLWAQREFQGIKSDLTKKSFDASILISDPGPPQVGRY